MKKITDQELTDAMEEIVAHDLSQRRSTIIKWIVGSILIGGIVWLALVNNISITDMLLVAGAVLLLYALWNRNNIFSPRWVRWLGWFVFALWIISRIWRASL